MDIEDSDKYVLDVKHTIISNTPYSLLLLVIGMFIIKGFSILHTFESEEMFLLGFIVFMFTSVKLLSWIRMPNLEYKPRR